LYPQPMTPVATMRHASPKNHDYNCAFLTIVEMGMKMSDPHACHIVGHGCHLLDRSPCPTIHHGLIRLGRNVTIPFDELSNDFLVHISHFVDDVLNQGAHRGHSDDSESHGHHDLEVRFLRRGEGSRQRDELASHGPQWQ